jgi:hypothetical protein
VADLAERVCDKFPRWGAVDAGQVRLYLVDQPPGGDEPSEGAEATALDRWRLQSGWTLEHAGVASGSWLLARVSQPAAAVGASSCGAHTFFATPFQCVLRPLLQPTAPRLPRRRCWGGNRSE